jgi:L-serine dehydratase
MTFTAYTNSVKQYSATYYSIGGGFVVKKSVSMQRKNSYKMCFSFLNRKSVRATDFAIAKTKKISDIVYENENPCVQRRLFIAN